METFPKRPDPTRSLFGDLALVAFLIAQALDGILTYLGVLSFGRSAEANPLVAFLMAAVGDGAGLTGAKVVAASLGMALHVTGVHRVVAALTVIYLGAAIAPWTAILFF